MHSEQCMFLMFLPYVINLLYVLATNEFKFQFSIGLH